MDNLSSLELLSFADVSVSITSLSLGDVVWVGLGDDGEEYVLETVLERKRIDDLAGYVHRFFEPSLFLAYSD